MRLQPEHAAGLEPLVDDLAHGALHRAKTQGQALLLELPIARIRSAFLAK